jgi:cyclophilin family peptidyl-prolyl cis-trans isomerase
MVCATKATILSVLLLLLCADLRAQDEVEKNGKKGLDPQKTISQAREIFRLWRKQHLLQEAASLQARILNTRLLRLRTAKDVAKRKEELEGLHKKARKAFHQMQSARARAAAAFSAAGQAIEKAIDCAPGDPEVHSWRAELFATLASSGRSIGSVLGPKPRGLLTFRFFSKGLESAEIAYAANKEDGVRIFLKARLLGVFNHFEDACTLLEKLVKSPRALPRDRVLLATYRFYLNDFDASLALLSSVKDNDAGQAEAVELKRIVLRSKVLWEKEKKRHDASKNRPKVLLQLGKKRIVLELFEDEAPNTVANFIHLVETKFYNQLSFHRVISSFIAQAGDPQTHEFKGVPGTTGPKWKIADEIHKDSFAHFRGSLAMAKGKKVNSSGSQFYLCLVPVPYMDGQSTVFGRVVKGLEHLKTVKAGTKLTRATVLNKRDHPYNPKKIKGP